MLACQARPGKERRAVAYAATVVLMVRQISTGFESGWFSIAVVVAFAAASALLVRELAALRAPR